MFVKSTRLLAGAVFLSPVAAVVSHAVPAAASEVPKNNCVIGALSAAEISAGQQTTTVCFETAAEAKASIFGSSGFVSTQSIRPDGPLLLAYYDNGLADSDPRKVSAWIRGDSCDDVLYATSNWRPAIVRFLPQACSKAKHFEYNNFTGRSEQLNGPGYLQVLPGNVGSIKFGW